MYGCNLIPIGRYELKDWQSGSVDVRTFAYNIDEISENITVDRVELINIFVTRIEHNKRIISTRM